LKRRTDHGETTHCGQKPPLDAGLHVILCIGETEAHTEPQTLPPCARKWTAHPPMPRSETDNRLFIRNHARG
jgi:triosephosphate isomerase